MTPALSAAATARDHRILVLPYDGDGTEWDALVARADGSTFCHLWGWRTIMADVLGHECLYAIALDLDGQWRGILPLVRVRGLLVGHYLVSLPFLNYGGPLGTPAARERLAAYGLSEARRSGADLLELRSRDAVPAVLREVRRKVIVLLELPASAERLWQSFPSKLRSQVRRPQKEGMETRFGLDQVEPFYEVFARHMRDLGTPVLPRPFLERIAHTFADIVVFGVVYWNERPVASGCGFVWGSEFEMTWAAALREFSRAAPNMLLYSSFMERMIARGIRRFNFGRCTPGGGTHRFKQQWGGVDVPLPWAQWSPRGLAATPTPDRVAFRVATAVWRRLPVPLTKAVGPALGRLLP